MNLFDRVAKYIRSRKPSLYPSASPTIAPTYRDGICPYCNATHRHFVSPEPVIQESCKARMKRWVRERKNKVVDGVVEGWFGIVAWAGRRR